MPTKQIQGKEVSSKYYPEMMIIIGSDKLSGSISLLVNKLASRTAVSVAEEDL